MISLKTSEVSSIVVFPQSCFYCHSVFMVWKVHCKFAQLFYLSHLFQNSKSFIFVIFLLFVCFLSGPFGNIWTDSWDAWTLFIPVISRWEINSVAFAGDYEKYFFHRQATAFYFRRYILILFRCRTVCLEFPAESKVIGVVLSVFRL